MFLICGLTFFQGLISAPNTTDSMVYHITRVMYWIQNNSVFQTYPYTLHDSMGPFSEYVLLHLYLLIKSDRLLFFSQWFAFVSSLYVSYLIALKLKINKQIVPWLILLLISIPISVLQATSTQSDVLMTLFVLLSLYYSIETNSIKNTILLGFTCGLGILTKQTFVIFAVLPGVLFLWGLRHRSIKQKILRIILVGVIIVAFNILHINQNMRLYNSPLGKAGDPKQETVYTNEIVSIGAITSNVIKNSVFQIPIPFINKQIYRVVADIHKLLRISADDLRVTLIPPFFIPSVLYPQEDLAVNPIHFILICIGLYMGIKLWKTKQLPFLIIIGVSFTFILFSALIKWQPFHSRLLLPLFFIGVISSVILLEKHQFFLRICAIVSVCISILLIFFNFSRPFISYSFFFEKVKGLSIHSSAKAPESFFIKPRLEQFFNARWYWYKPYQDVAKKLNVLPKKQNVCVSFFDLYEYPFWLMLKKFGIVMRVYPASHCPKNESAYYVTTFQDQSIDAKKYIYCQKTEDNFGILCLN